MVSVTAAENVKQVKLETHVGSLPPTERQSCFTQLFTHMHTELEGPQ